MAGRSAEIQRQLDEIDWNFARSTTFAGSVHALHWFPGNFIPQIPSYLIQVLSAKGDLILDPFCGSGTTGVEAVALGRRAIQGDSSRACVAIARGKMAALGGRRVAAAVRSLLEMLVWDDLLVLRDPMGAEGSHPELRRWLHPHTHAQLLMLWKLVNEASGPARDALRMVFTDVLFDCASTAGARTRTGGRRRHHWGWIADNVAPTSGPVRHNAVALMRARLSSAVKVLEAQAPDGSKGAAASLVAVHDARALPLAGDSVDLVVTSPPYVSMIDYVKANRLTYLWMNWPLEAEQRAEIGARYRRSAAGALRAYLGAMEVVFGEMTRVLRPGGYCALVVGASRKCPTAIGDVMTLARRVMSPIWGPVGRTPMRRRVSERRGTEPTEYVCVMQKA